MGVSSALTTIQDSNGGSDGKEIKIIEAIDLLLGEKARALAVKCLIELEKARRDELEADRDTAFQQATKTTAELKKNTAIKIELEKKINEFDLYKVIYEKQLKALRMENEKLRKAELDSKEPLKRLSLQRAETERSLLKTKNKKLNLWEKVSGYRRTQTQVVMFLEKKREGIDSNIKSETNSIEHRKQLIKTNESKMDELQAKISTKIREKFVKLLEEARVRIEHLRETELNLAKATMAVKRESDKWALVMKVFLS